MQTAEICGNENYLKLLKKKLLFTTVRQNTYVVLLGPHKENSPVCLYDGLGYFLCVLGAMLLKDSSHR